MLCRLLYVSRIAPAASDRLTSTMEDILVVSAARNRQDAVTGFLLADGESFVQVLEGTDALVTACYERILGDRRHMDVRLRFLAGIEARRFPRWSMCGLCLSELDDAILSPPDIGFDLSGADAGALLQHLEGLAARYARRLDALHEQLIAM
jgi:hypothetical protein